MLAGSGRPRKACNPCKRLKVRCSGDRPACKRCARLKHNCVYAVLAATSPSNDHVHPTGMVFSPPGTPVQGHPRTSSSECITSEVFAPQMWTISHPATPEKTSLGIPNSLVTTLVDVYYTHVYNASLMLHRTSFLQQLESGTVAPALLLSICAFASIFYRDSQGNCSLREHGFSIEWAKTAGQQALQEVETPRQKNIATHLNLALFWYSRGVWRRSYAHKAIAIQIAHTLGLGIERRGKEKTFDSEIRRRRFWACYLVNCHGADSSFSIFSAKAIKDLALPWHEKDFTTGRLTQSLVTLHSSEINGGVWAEVIKALSIWSSVYEVIKSMTTDMHPRITSIHSLDAHIKRWWSKVPDHMKLSTEVADTAEIQIFPKLVLINAVYHQSLCALHASIVPLFSWSSDGGDEDCGVATQISAQIAFEHACAASTMFELILNSSDASTTPSFVAYAAYCSCAIQIPFLWSSDQAIQELVRANIKINVQMIHTVGNHWKFAAMLAIHVQYIYRLHFENRITLEGEPKALASSKLKGFRVSAKHARESILSHNGILWARGEGCVEQGEEVFDLGINNRADPAVVPKEPRPANESTASNSWSQFQSEGNSAEASQLFPFLDPDHNHTTTSPNVTNLDFFHPFLDSENFGMFTDGEFPDFNLAANVDFDLDFEGVIPT